MSNGSLSTEVKWMIGVTIAAVIAIAIAAVAVSVTVLQLSRIADMRNHEHRTNASNSAAIVEVQRLVDGMRDDYRDRMHGAEAVLNELRDIRQSLNAGAEPHAARRRDIDRALSNLDRALTVWLLFRPVSTSDVTQRLKEIRHELQAVRRQLDGEGGTEDHGEGGTEDHGEGGTEDHGEDGTEDHGEDGTEDHGEDGTEDDGRR